MRRDNRGGDKTVEGGVTMRKSGRIGWMVPALLALALGACGGGGSNVRSTPTSVTPPSTPSTPQPPIDAQLALTNTYAAHDAGYTGAGVTIGFVDSGIMRSNPTVAGRVLQEYIDVDPNTDRKSTRLNSSHPSISYAVFCLKKKKKKTTTITA